MKYFKLEEFACKHCGKVRMDQDFLANLDYARELAKTPFVITSGYRCEAHNNAINGDPDNHPKGIAADIACDTGPKRLAIVSALLAAGFERIGLGPTFIHVDQAPGKIASMFYE